MSPLRKHLDRSDTIFSLTTGALPCAVAIVRVSGPKAFGIAREIFEGDLPYERGMHFGVIREPQGRKLDEILLLSFVAPHSFTGEDSVEFHLHGSVSIVERLNEILLQQGARPAERGEFSYRAHFNGKLSASALETLGDVYLSRQPADLARIYARVDGALEQQITTLRTEVIRLQAILDTAIDFSDEYSTVVHHAREPLAKVIRGCSEMIQRYESFRSGSVAPKLVLAGLPNAGKSSLFNALLCRYRAIVHEEPGTTRDVIEEDVRIEGRPWKLVDTAGVRPGTRGAESVGISLGEDFLSAASYWILVVDGSQGLSDGEKSLLSRFSGVPHLVVWNKRDLPSWVPPSFGVYETVSVSAKTGDGLPQLWDRLGAKAKELSFGDAQALPTAVQAGRLRRVVAEANLLEGELAKEVPPEYLAERNRHILLSLEAVVGEIETDDVLDRVFSEFCIGK